MHSRTVANIETKIHAAERALAARIGGRLQHEEDAGVPIRMIGKIKVALSLRTRPHRQCYQ